jgi:hypothetical protein
MNDVPHCYSRTVFENEFTGRRDINGFARLIASIRMFNTNLLAHS